MTRRRPTVSLNAPHHGPANNITKPWIDITRPI